MADSAAPPPPPPPATDGPLLDVPTALAAMAAAVRAGAFDEVRLLP
jgi:hypothetical protein